MKFALLTGLFGLQAAAFPYVLEELQTKRQGLPDPTAAQALSKARTNCGAQGPCLVFDEEAQRVSTTGEHAYASPAADEIRGPCPGLNAAANHGYLSRSGVTTIPETIAGLGELYGMTADLAGFLAAYAVIFTGDPVLGSWSIGGPTTKNGLTKGLLGGAQGISYSHNVYEGDTSIGRKDAYINNGDAHSLDLDRFRSAYAVGQADGSDRYTLDKFSQNFDEKVNESIATNPYYFTGPFSTTLVSPAAYNFVINFMSNHSEEEKSGYLNGEMFKQFFAVEGDSPENFKWLPGQERIPDNWYRRTLTNGYSAVSVFQDLGVEFLAYPGTFRLGGNTKGVNTYTGISLTDFTGGAMNLENLASQDGSGGACFSAQLVQSLVPDVANLPLGWLAPITSLIADHVAPIKNGFDCPIVNKFDQSLFNQFPGRSYSPTGPGTNY